MPRHSYLSSTVDQKEKERGREKEKGRGKEGKNNRQVPTLINSDVPPRRVDAIDLSFALIIGEDDIEKREKAENSEDYR